MPALQSALELGVRYIEFDVQLTADHEPVLLHDANLVRVAGIDRNALEMTWSDLRQVKVGESARFGVRYTDVGIPALSRAVTLLADFPQVTAFVELKRASLRAFGAEVMVRRVQEVLQRIAQQCVIISFDLAALQLARQVTELPIGWVLSDLSPLTSLECSTLRPDFLFCDHELLPADGSRLWHGPWRWALYEITTRKLAMELAARGAHLVETMAVRTMLREMQALRSASR